MKRVFEDTVFYLTDSVLKANRRTAELLFCNGEQGLTEAIQRGVVDRKKYRQHIENNIYSEVYKVRKRWFLFGPDIYYIRELSVPNGLYAGLSYSDYALTKYSTKNLLSFMEYWQNDKQEILNRINSGLYKNKKTAKHALSFYDSDIAATNYILHVRAEKANMQYATFIELNK